MSDEPVPVPIAMSFSEALGRLDYKAMSGGKIDDAWFSCPTPGEKCQKLLLGPVKLKEITLETLWKSIFASSSTFLKEYHDKRRDSDQTYGKWEFSSDKGSAIRMFSCTTLVDHPRADTPTEFNEAHRIALIKDPANGGKQKLLVQFSAQTPNVPFGYSFRVETWMLYEDDGGGNVDVTMYGGTKKMTFAFSAIGGIASPRAIRELKAGYVMLLEMVGERLLKDGADLKDVGRDDTGSAGAAPALPAEGTTMGDSGGGSDNNNSILTILTIVLCVVVAILLVFVMMTVRDLEGSIANERSMNVARKRSLGNKHSDMGENSGGNKRKRGGGTPLDSLLQGSAIDVNDEDGDFHTTHRRRRFRDTRDDVVVDDGGNETTSFFSWTVIALSFQSVALIGGGVYVMFFKQ